LGLFVWIAFAFAASASDAELKRGEIIQVLRPQMLFYYGKPHHMAKAGETYEVLDVRVEKKQVFVATKEGDRIIALSLPLDAVQSMRKAKESERIEKSAALFAGLIPTLHLKINPKGLEQLRKDPRNYIEGEIEEAGGKTYNNIAIKLKGSAGSFQGIDQRPGFSINCSKYKGGDRFHGLKRFQLNNCAQDGTALNELVAGEMARAAGVPASRCTHALVTLNGRDLGIYVLKEGFTEDFLAAFFKKTDGQLYDGGFCAEIQENMELDRGEEERRDGLRKLVAAMKEGDAQKQFTALTSLVDVDAYLRYLALENIMCHWDGYSFNRNNYRIYENPETGRFHFILHGMDQMFGDTNHSLQRDPGGQAGAILWRRPEIRERYWLQLMDIYEKVLKPVDWTSRVEDHGRRLLAALPPEKAKQYEGNIPAARDRIGNRVKQIRVQIEKPRVVNTLLTKGLVELKTGEWAPQVNGGESKEVQEDGRPCFYLQAKGEANASWRMSLNIPAGKYRFEARLKTRGVDAVAAENGEGAGLRVSGGSRAGQKCLKGDAPWEVIAYEINSAGQDYTLVAELRARSGELWIDRESLRVVRVP
jgi:spore coat protein H